MADKYIVSMNTTVRVTREVEAADVDEIVTKVLNGEALVGRVVCETHVMDDSTSMLIVGADGVVYLRPD